MTTHLRVGGASMPLDEAFEFAARYLAATTTSWAYPAYDAYPGSGKHGVEQQDLLAVALLNAHQKPLATYYGFEKLLPEINARLAGLDQLAAAEDFAAADEATIEAIAKLYGVLDQFPTPEVGLTKFSKVLHRKRPGLLPLTNVNIRRCYGESLDGPVASVRGRSWEEYCLAWLPELQRDLRSQMESWQNIADLAKGPTITPLRALDIIGWELGRPGRATN